MSATHPRILVAYATWNTEGQTMRIVGAVAPVRIVAVDVDESKLALAQEVGADEALASGPSTAAEVMELTRGLGTELVLDCVGSDATLALAAACSRAQGDLVAVGLAGGTLTYGVGVVPWECALTATYWASTSWWLELETL